MSQPVGIRYWVRFIVGIRPPPPPTADATQIPDVEDVDSEMGVTRAAPISEFAHIAEVAQAIARSFCEANKLPIECVAGVRIVGWQRFEDGSRIQVVPVNGGKMVLPS